MSNDTTIYPYCIAVRVSDQALDALLEQVAQGGSGAYTDAHPWVVAKQFWQQAQTAGQQLALVLAAGTDPEFSRWTTVDDLDVVELHRSAWQTRAKFGQIQPVHPIFTPIDSLMLKPAQEQLDREVLEGITPHRTSLGLTELHPYAICETPAYMLQPATESESVS